jgi:hypothetical protein
MTGPDSALWAEYFITISGFIAAKLFLFNTIPSPHPKRESADGKPQCMSPKLDNCVRFWTLCRAMGIGTARLPPRLPVS